MIYKKTTEERLARLEEENIANTNEIYRLANIVDFLESRIKHLEDLVVSDGKWTGTSIMLFPKNYAIIYTHWNQKPYNVKYGKSKRFVINHWEFWWHIPDGMG